MKICEECGWPGDHSAECPNHEDKLPLRQVEALESIAASLANMARAEVESIGSPPRALTKEQIDAMFPLSTKD